MEEKKLYNAVRKIITLADGRQIEIETGKLAKQADGSVVVKMGDTMLLGTVVAAKDAKPDTDFMPLQVEYKEKYAACGRYPGGFMKREGKANDSEVLVARLIDRALRPLFPADYHAEVYVTVNLISADKDIQPDALAGLAASAALAVSDIPFGGPISEVRVARIDGNYVINPNYSEMGKVDLDIMVGGTIDNILMVEGEMKEVSEEVMLGAIKFAHEEIKKHCAVQIELSKELGKDVKRTYCHEVNDEELRQTIISELYDKAYAIATSGTMKHEREEKFNALEAEFASRYTEEELVEKAPLIHKYFHDDVQKKAMRNMILDEGKRLDGRKTDEIRPIWCEVGYLPAAHGSAIFTRGETQSLTSVTLGTKLDEKVKDEVLVQGTEQFVLHYNFPPFSTGEAKAARGLSRREIGHGHLAWRALKPMIPLGEENPYAVRIVSDILESNGSSSMATVCAGTLALMDAGVKLKKPVSGIAMGLISDSQSGKWAVLSDILGDEDHLGDMDFKVTGTKDGITATQMDIKVDGLSYEVLAAALEQARKGRMHILGKLTECIAEPREDYKPCVPRIVQIVIPAGHDRSGYRPGRKGDPGHPEDHGHDHHHHRGGQQGHRGHLRPGQDRPRRSAGPHQGHRSHPRSGRDVPRQSPLDRRLRRLRRDHAGQGRPAPHLRDRLQAVRDHGGDRTQGGRRDRRQADRYGSEDQQAQIVAQGAAAQARGLCGAGASSAWRASRARRTPRTPRTS